jgi:hypothetical protein
MEKTKAKKITAEKAAKKGFYIVTPERKGAGPPKNDKYTESQRSYYARRYMQIHSARSSAETDDL